MYIRLRSANENFSAKDITRSTYLPFIVLLSIFLLRSLAKNEPARMQARLFSNKDISSMLYIEKMKVLIWIKLFFC